jgi:PAP2 superfamily
VATAVVSRKPRRWPADLALRMRHRFIVKVLGVSAFTTLFLAGYFHLLRNPAYPVVEMPLTALDALIGFQPHALWIYLSLWVYVGIAPGLMLRWRELIVFCLWVNAMLWTGLACFYFWPTEVPPLTVEVAGHAGFAMLQGVDAAGNACPSMHVAAAVFAACWIERLLRTVAVPPWLRALNGLWVVAIAYSTLATKQHVVLDVLPGALLGLAFAWPSLRFSQVSHGAGRPVEEMSADIIDGR